MEPATTTGALLKLSPPLIIGVVAEATWISPYFLGIYLLVTIGDIAFWLLRSWVFTRDFDIIEFWKGACLKLALATMLLLFWTIAMLLATFAVDWTIIWLTEAAKVAITSFAVLLILAESKSIVNSIIRMIESTKDGHTSLILVGLKSFSLLIEKIADKFMPDTFSKKISKKWQKR